MSVKTTLIISRTDAILVVYETLANKTDEEIEAVLDTLFRYYNFKIRAETSEETIKELKLD